MKIKRLRYNRRKVFLGLFLFLCLLGVTLGYAFVTTKLTIDGTATVKDAKWDIHFDNYTAPTGSVTPTTSPTISDTTITFAAKLEDPGDFYGFTIDVTNQGTINADISNISLTPDFSTIDYIDATVAYNNGNPIQTGDILAAGKTKTIKVLLKYKEGIADNLYPTQNQIHNVTLTLDYEQYVGEIQSWVLPQGKTKDTLTVGDEICLADDATQCFSFIKYDGNDVVMLAKYNLNVGPNAKGTATNIQDSDVRGDYYGMTTYGTVAFSTTNYWNGSVTYPADIYDAINYAGEPGTTNYSIAYYVEEYKDILETAGVTIKDARLLTYSEAADTLGCNYVSCPTIGNKSFIRNTSFWLGCSDGIIDVWNISQDGLQENVRYNNDNKKGVRPIIVVEKSEL